MSYSRERAASIRAKLTAGRMFTAAIMAYYMALAPALVKVHAQTTAPPPAIDIAVTNVAIVGLNPVAVAVHEAGDRIYVVNSGGNSLSILDRVTATVVGNEVPVGQRAVDIAINKTTGHVYVANADSNDLTVINSATGAKGTIALGFSPTRLIANEISDKTYAFSPSTARLAVVGGGNLVKSETIADQPSNATITLADMQSSAGLSMLFSSATPDICVFFPNVARTIVFLGVPGTCTIVANQYGDNDYLAAAPVAASFQVLPSPPPAPTVANVFPRDGYASVALLQPSAGFGVTQYHFYCTNSGIPTINLVLPAVGVGYVVRNLINGATYSCNVTASNAYGEGPISATFTVTPSASLPVPNTVPPGFPLPVPSKIIGEPALLHSGAMGAGSAINAHIVNPAVCNGSMDQRPFFAWIHDVFLVPSAGTENVALGGNELLMYRFTPTRMGSGTIFVPHSALGSAMEFQSVWISDTPCGPALSGVANPDTTLCRAGGGLDRSLHIRVDNSGTSTAPHCSLTFGVPYYLNMTSKAACVTDCGGAVSFQISDAPAINAVQPPAAAIGSTVTIDGIALRGVDDNANAIVSVGGVPAQILNITDAQIRFVVPAGTPVGATALMVTRDGRSASVSFFVLSPPDAPAITQALGGDGNATIYFSPPTSPGTSPISSYRVECGALSASASGSPITVTGLSNDSPYNCTAFALSAAGTSPASAPVSVTPTAAAPLTLIGAYSRKSHNGAIYDLPLGVGAAASRTIEPRALQGGHTIVFRFNKTIAAAGTAGTSLGSLTPSANGNELVLQLTGVADAFATTITVANVNNAGLTYELTVGFLLADINGSGRVEAGDCAAIRAMSGRDSSTDNFVRDLNLTGKITAADVIACKTRIDRMIP